jgi:(4S)-4-hydroxy-5-phosphonooxypentane-2,3-dione isomerase
MSLSAQVDGAQLMPRAAGRKQGNPMGYAVVVEFQLKPGALTEFRRLIDANASASMQNEAGCLQFDVLEPEDGENRVLLYEVYSDRSAFAEHAQTEHYKTFDTASGPLYLRKLVTACKLVFGGDTGVRQTESTIA